MNNNSKVKYNRLIRGTNSRTGILWKRFILIILFGFSFWIIFIQQPFSKTPTIKEVHIYKYSNKCTYCQTDQPYSLNLQPRKYLPPFHELKNDGYNELIDLKHFSFIINQEHKCSNNYIFLLLIISSAPGNQERRDTIRNTWGKEDTKVKTIFLLGAVTDQKLQESIEWENDLNDDIVQGNFIDSYLNLTYKTVMALKYVTYHCPNAVYTLKLDDDIFVNTPLMKNYLTNDLSPFGAENLLQCIVLKNKPPMRDKTSKWYVSEKMYAPKFYPTYCQGPYVLFSQDVLFKLYRESQKLHFFFLEDVFTYGLAASHIKGLQHSDLYRLTLGHYPQSMLAEGGFDKFNFLFGIFETNISNVKNFWNYVINRPVRSSVYDYSELSDF